MLEPLFNRLLQTNFVKQRYAVAYVVKYARDWGLRRLTQAVGRQVLAQGPSVLVHPRQTILDSLSRRQKAVAVHVGGKSAPSVILPFDEAELRNRMQKWKVRPTISIVVPTYNTPAGVLVKMINSVTAQVYSHWELCIADDCSPQPGIREILDTYTGDPRIKVCYLEKNAGISAATNEAIKLSTGEYIGLLDHDDEITGDALFRVVEDLNKNGVFDIIYSDECKVDEAGIEESDIFYKPDWSPELLLSMMYTGHFSVYRKAFLEERVGYFRSEYDFSQDYDLFLRASARTENIRHIERVLYKWRKIAGSAAMGDKPYARKSNVAAVHDVLNTLHIPGEAVALSSGNRVRIRFDSPVLVSLIVPTDSAANLRETVKSIITRTSYPAYELVIVTNSRLITQMKTEGLASGSRIVYVAYDKPYNFSDKCNEGAAAANGEVVVFFNDDVRPLEEDWLEGLVESLWIPGVGGVSPLMLYENDTIQYAGMVTGVRGLLGTAFHTYSSDTYAQFNFTRVLRNVSILSGACLAMRRSLFLELNGFDAVNTPIYHSDVDLSFRIREHGQRLVFTGFSRLRHIGHLSIGEVEKKEAPTKKDKADMYIIRRWAEYLAKDPYFTRSMRNFLYLDGPKSFDFFAPAVSVQRTAFKGDVLLVGHDLSLSGAPLMLLDLAKILSEEGYFVVMSCEKDGPLRSFYQREGIPVIADALQFRKDIAFERLARNFDLIICNTIVSWPVVDQMQSLVPTIWWIQEGEAIHHRFGGLQHILHTLKKAGHVISPSNYAFEFIKEQAPNAVRIYNASPDLYDVRMTPASVAGGQRKLVFSLIGSLEYRKGQDLLLKALRLVDPSLASSVEFRIIGRRLDGVAELEFARSLEEDLVKRQPFTVHFLGQKNHDECLELMQESDVILCPSRDDPFPVVLTEAFSMAKTCIVSSHTGMAELITPGVNGHVFTSGKEESLADRISDVLRHPEGLASTGLKARETYERYLTMDQFRQAMLEYIGQVLGHPSYKVSPMRQKQLKEVANF